MGRNKVKSNDEVREKIEYNSTLEVALLENMIVNDFKWKLEVGREIKKIIVKHRIPQTSLRNEFVEALGVFENYSQEKGLKNPGV